MKYKVTIGVKNISVGEQQIEVEARTKEEARKKAQSLVDGNDIDKDAFEQIDEYTADMYVTDVEAIK